MKTLQRTSVFHAFLILLVVSVGLPSVHAAEEIALVKEGGVYKLPVKMNGVLTLHFILDTGAADVQIPADVALTLVRAGTIQSADFLPGRTYTLADGTTVRSPRFMLRSVHIGSRVMTQVPASIGNLDSALLLGQSVLEKLGTWSMDSQRRGSLRWDRCSPGCRPRHPRHHCHDRREQPSEPSAPHPTLAPSCAGHSARVAVPVGCLHRRASRDPSGGHLRSRITVSRHPRPFEQHHGTHRGGRQPGGPSR